jgi:hypothetical protein
MPGADYFRKQAAIFDRVAAQCTVPELVGYYQGLARDYRARADAEAPAAPPSQPDDGA